jgi:hypothetical protein
MAPDHTLPSASAAPHQDTANPALAAPYLEPALAAPYLETVKPGEMREGSEPHSVESYRHHMRSAEEAYSRIPALWRFRLAGLDTLTAQTVSAVGLIAWGYSLPWRQFAGLLIVSRAYAQNGNLPFEPRPYINLVIFIALLLVFALSVWVTYFGKNAGTAQRADTVAKALLGFFIGATSNYLGLAAR